MSTDPFGLVGQVLDGQFRVEELVGEGGFSAVYRGHHIGLNEPIAIKSLKLPVALQTSLVDTFVQRFRDESRLLYRLSQGNLHIVRSIAAGTTTSATGVLVPFMVLEWLNGRSLAADFGVRRDLGKQGRSLTEIVQTFATAADALSYAHAQGVVHRDLNPGNFFLATTAQGIKMKVLDFGVAKVMHESTLGLGPRAQTMGQFRIFAPAYGAPEQFDDSVGNVGTASDVYSFALVLLEAMRDAPVNEGQNLADFARFAVDPARRPTPRLLGLSVADEVEAVFARATQLDPKKRWQTVAELWGALTSAIQSAGDKQPTTLARPGVGGPAPKTLPLGATFPFPRPPPRPAAGAPPSAGGAKPASGPAASMAKATQRFGNALAPAPGSAPGSGAATMMGLPPSSGAKPGAPASAASADASRPTSRPAAPPPNASAAATPKPPPSGATGGEEEEGDEPTKVAATDPRILKMVATEAQERDTTIAATSPRAPGERLPFEDDDEEEKTSANVQPPAAGLPPSMPPLPAAGARFGDTVAMSEPAVPLPSLTDVADEEDIERAPDSGGTLIMAPGQTTGAPLPSASSPSHSSGAMPAASPQMHGGLASTLAFSGPGQAPATPRLSGPAPDAAWPATQLSPGQSQLYAQPHQPMGGEGFAPGQSQLYAQQQQQAYPPQGGPPMYGAQMHSASMPGAPGMQGAPPGYAAPAFPPPDAAPSAGGKKTPVLVLALAGGLLLAGLAGIGAFVFVGHEGKGAGPTGSASGASSANAPPAATTGEPPAPPPVAPTPPPPVAEVVDAGAPAPVAEEVVDAGATAATNAGSSSGGTPSGNTTPTASPTYTWPPPATPTPPPTPPAHVPTPVVAPQTHPSPPAPAPAAPVDPNAWNESAARARLSQANGVLVACRRDGGVSGPGKALVTFASDGTVISVSLDAPYVGTKEGECASRQFQRAKVSPFNGGPQTVKHSFEIPK